MHIFCGQALEQKRYFGSVRRVPDDCLRCFQTKLQAVGMWTESTL
jgi:hypothetical protein